jgi:hypothetical protein
MELLIMEKITDNTVFDFYFSKLALAVRGGMKVNGVVYTEKIVHGKKPTLNYSDTELVATVKNIDMKIERI